MSGTIEKRVWDPLVRIAHWTFAFGCAAAFLTEELRGPHKAVGYVVLSAVLVRIVWGLAGSEHARFESFLRGPAEVRAYPAAMLRREEPAYEGHNPSGALMSVALLALLLVIGVSGWMTTLDLFWGVALAEDLHEATAELLLWLVPVHVAGVLFAGLRHRENLVTAMITGRERTATASAWSAVVAPGRQERAAPFGSAGRPGTAAPLRSPRPDGAAPGPRARPGRATGPTRAGASPDGPLARSPPPAPPPTRFRRSRGASPGTASDRSRGPAARRARPADLRRRDRRQRREPGS